MIGAAVATPVTVVGVAGAVSALAPESAPTPIPLVPGALPVQDAPPVAGPGGSPAVAGPSPTSQPEQHLAAVDAFWGAGYEYCDAEALAAGHGGDVWEAKVAAGGALLAGEAIAPPSGCVDPASTGSTAIDAFLDAGYEYCDAVELAAAVQAADPYETKVAIGSALLAGAAVPAPTGCAA